MISPNITSPNLTSPNVVLRRGIRFAEALTSDGITQVVPTAVLALAESEP